MDSIAVGLLAIDEEEIVLAENIKLQRRQLRDANNPLELNGKAFRKNFRINKDAFKYLLGILDEHIVDRRSSSITSLSRLVCFLRFLAEGGCQHGVGKDFNVALAQSTVSKTISIVLNIFERNLCHNWISYSMDAAEQAEAKRYFFGKISFPGVIMCVDGTHVELIAPSSETFLFYNRKGRYSLNVMIICDHNMRIRAVDTRNPGCNHDSHIWKLSNARNHFERQYREGNNNTRLLGDAGYPLEPWLMTPFRSTRSGSPESIYNEHHVKTRVIVDRTIGVWKSRFRCMLSERSLHYTPQKATQMINVACALHNICVFYRDEQFEPIFDTADIETTEADNEFQRNLRGEAERTRQRILETFLA